MVELFSYLEQFQELSSREKDLIETHCSFLELKKGNYFLRLNEHCNKIGFVTKGVLRVFYFDKTGKEITKYFAQKDQFATNLKSYRDNMVSDTFIKAELDTEMIIISKEKMNDLSNQIPNWSKLANHIIESKLVEKVNYKATMINQDAAERYINFLKTHKNLVNEIPLNQIASYLGITQYSLSRIRKKLTQNHILSNGKI